MPTDCLRVGDAYAHCGPDAPRWTIGTGTLRLELALEAGRLRLVRLGNTTVEPPREYARASSATDLFPFAPDTRFRLEAQEATPPAGAAARSCG